tara:strand:- start:1249 stop:1851 length:603 start_codon:yes stop_codon:yes gene_type:complete
MKKFGKIICMIFCLVIGGGVASEEVSYRLVEKNEIYEIRYYEKVLVAEVEYAGVNGGFGDLFNYISGANNQVSPTKNAASSVKIEMTTPVTRINYGDRNVMQFFLPNRFTLETAPKPVNPNVRIKQQESGYFAAIQYSGRASEENFHKRAKILTQSLNANSILYFEPAIWATYNSPFTPPFMRRNEAIYKIEWNDIQFKL